MEHHSAARNDFLSKLIFTQNEQYQKIALETEEFLRKEVQPRAEEIHSLKMIPEGLVQALGTSGFFGIMIPRHFGGREQDCLARLINVETMARGHPDVGALLQIAQLGVSSIIEFGSQEQKTLWLPELAEGKRICTISITEEMAGSHVASTNTTYVNTGGHYLINGEKWFIGNAPIANLHVVFAREKDGKDFSTFIVEGERHGVDNGDRHNTLGLPSFPFGKVKFTNVAIPHSNLLGRSGQGQEIIHKVIARYGRPGLTGLALGIHQRILDTTIEFTHARKLYGKCIDALPEIREKIFEIYRRVEISRSLAYSAAASESAGLSAGRALALAKYINSDYACQSAKTASEIFGARANLAEYRTGQLTLDAYMTLAPSGTADVLRKRIMEDLLGERYILLTNSELPNSLSPTLEKLV
jgi:alkylation response protein AidB-like acyl-CoA dehydrogenase